MDVQTAFWKKHLELDYLERIEHLHIIAKVIINQADCDGFTEKERIQAMASLLNSYFEDLHSYMEAEAWDMRVESMGEDR